MADNIILESPSPAGDTARAIDKTTYKTPVSLIDVGGTGAESLVTSSNPLPSQLRSEIVDDAAFTPATTRIIMVGATFDNTLPDSVDEGDGGALRMSANRCLFVNLRDNAGNERGLNIDASGNISVATVTTVTTVSTLTSITNAVTVAQTTAANLNCTEASAASIKTAVELIDNAVYTDGTGTPSAGIAVMGTDGTNPQLISVSATGVVNVSAVQSGTWNIGTVTAVTSITNALPAGTNNIGDVDVLTLPSTTNAGATVKTADYDSGVGTDTVTMFGIALPASGGAVAGGTSTNPVRTDPTGTTTQPVSGTVTANQGGSWSVSVTGAVDTELPAAAALADNTANPTVPAVGAFTMVFDGTTWDRAPGTTADGLLVNLGANNDVTVTGSLTTVSTVTAVTDITNAVTVKGDVAHDTADSNSPQKIGAKAITALSGVTAVASADRTDLYADLDGILPVRLGAVHGDFVSGNASETAGASTAVIAAQGVGIRVYLTDVTLTNTSSTNTYCEIKDGTTVKWTFPVPANGGVTHRFATPLAGTANTAWNFDMGAAVTTAYASFSGYKSKV